jgi:hypothetical protein
MSRFLRLLLAAAAAADRALVPPLSGILLDRPHPEDGTLRETALTADEGDAIVGHQRFLWSLVDVTPLLADNATVRLLEPSYTTHATPHLLATGDTAMLAALHDPVDLDLRFLWKFDQLVEHLLAPPFRCVSPRPVYAMLKVRSLTSAQGRPGREAHHGRGTEGLLESLGRVDAARGDARAAPLLGAPEGRDVRGAVSMAAAGAVTVMCTGMCKGKQCGASHAARC